MPISRWNPHWMAIHFEEILSIVVLKVFFNYFVSSNAPNWEVICMIPIFGVIFGENFVICPPGCLYVGVTPAGFNEF